MKLPVCGAGVGCTEDVGITVCAVDGVTVMLGGMTVLLCGMTVML